MSIMWRHQHSIVSSISTANDHFTDFQWMRQLKYFLLESYFPAVRVEISLFFHSERTSDILEFRSFLWFVKKLQSKVGLPAVGDLTLDWMDGKRLDLDAPLLSFRRITVRPAGEEVAPSLHPRRKVLNFYNSDLMFGQVGVPGAVPFHWEKTPGQPKDSSVPTTTFELNSAAPKLPPGRSSKEIGADWLKGASLLPESETVVGTPTSITCSSRGRNEKTMVEDDEENNSTVCDDEDDAFSDARDAFSCAESFSMKCSMSAGIGAKDSLRSFTMDPQVKDFMMGRFLPAAQAMADDSPQRTRRKQPRALVNEGEKSDCQTIRRRRLPLDYQYQLSKAQLNGNELLDKEEEEESDDDYGSYAGSGFFSSKTCGLIQKFCLKTSIGPLNPIPGLKAQGRPQPRTHSRTSQINVLHQTSLAQAEDEDSWEAVYRYKLNHGYYPHRGSGSKLMTESNQLTSWSDSQMINGSSFLNSTGGALSPDKHEDSKRESGSWKTGSSDLCEKVYGSYWETTYCHGRLQGSGSTSPATERPPNQNSLSLPDTPDCNSVLVNIPSDAKIMTDSAGNSSAVEDEFQKTEESAVIETSEGYASKIAEPGFSTYCGGLNGVEIYGNDFDNNVNNDAGLNFKVDLLEKNDNSLALSLLPPPLPTSPSESWLHRTLTSVSSKGPHQHSYLGIQLHSKKQATRESAGGHNSVTYEKSSNLHPR